MGYEQWTMQLSGQTETRIHFDMPALLNDL
jgi:hypothetical protein